jgi:hypothetical protein
MHANAEVNVVSRKPLPGTLLPAGTFHLGFLLLVDASKLRASGKLLK